MWCGQSSRHFISLRVWIQFALRSRNSFRQPEICPLGLWALRVLSLVCSVSNIPIVQPLAEGGIYGETELLTETLIDIWERIPENFLKTSQ